MNFSNGQWTLSKGLPKFELYKIQKKSCDLNPRHCFNFREEKWIGCRVAVILIVFSTFAHATMRNLFCQLKFVDKKVSLRFINRIDCVYSCCLLQHGQENRALRGLQSIQSESLFLLFISDANINSLIYIWRVKETWLIWKSSAAQQRQQRWQQQVFVAFWHTHTHTQYYIGLYIWIIQFFCLLLSLIYFFLR